MTFFARLTPAWSSCRRRFGKGCSSEDSLFHRTPLLRTGIKSTGIFLHRRRGPDLADPKQPWNMPALTALHRFWVVPTRVPCYGRRGSRLVRSMAHFADRPRSFSCRTTMIISITTKRPMRQSHSRQTISCCRLPAPRNSFGILNSYLICIAPQVFLDQITLDSRGLRVFPRALAHCAMGDSLRCFFMTCGEPLPLQDRREFSLRPTSRRG